MALPRHMTLIARKPKGSDAEYVVVDRGPSPDPHHMRFVSATANAHSLAHGEWFWGHYFMTREEALAHFTERAPLA